MRFFGQLLCSSILIVSLLCPAVVHSQTPASTPSPSPQSLPQAKLDPKKCVCMGKLCGCTLTTPTGEVFLPLSKNQIQTLTR